MAFKSLRAPLRVLNDTTVIPYIVPDLHYFDRSAPTNVGGAAGPHTSPYGRHAPSVGPSGFTVRKVGVRGVHMCAVDRADLARRCHGMPGRARMFRTSCDSPVTTATALGTVGRRSSEPPYFW